MHAAVLGRGLKEITAAVAPEQKKPQQFLKNCWGQKVKKPTLSGGLLALLVDSGESVDVTYLLIFVQVAT